MAAINDLTNIIAGSQYMKKLNYFDIRESNKEFLRGDLWEFRFTTPPTAVYYPGDDIIQTRLTQVNPGIDYSSNGIEKQLRNNFMIYQQTSQITYGTISMTFVDREDQAIKYFIDDWRNKIADKDSKYSLRKEDLVAECELLILNSSRIPVSTLKFYNCLIMEGTFDENGSPEDTSDRADISMSMKFEHYERIFDNL